MTNPDHGFADRNGFFVNIWQIAREYSAILDKIVDQSAYENFDIPLVLSERAPDRHSVIGHNTLSRSSARAKAWLITKALPFWEKHAIDSQGGFYEDLNLKGRPKKKLVRRLRVQARQIYVYSHATDLGWYDGQSVADNALNFMLDKGYKIGGHPGFIHRLNPDYSVRDDSRDLYDNAFYLLGLAWHGSERARGVIDEMLSYLDGAMRLQDGFLESHPPVFPRRQNPHMHLFEAMMALFDRTGDRSYLDRAAPLYEMFTRKIFDPDNHVIIEYFDRAFNPLKADPYDSVEPGHAAEWIWLLRSYQTRTGTDTSQYADALYNKIIIHSSGWLVDERGFDDRIIRPTRRLWVQTELLKAHLAQAEYGVEGAADMAAAVLDGLFESYLKPNGTWMDQFDGDSRPCAQAMPVSTFYHIFCAIAESVRVASLVDNHHAS